jgi:hypothetical protein
MWNTIPRPSTQKEIKIKLLDLINDLVQLKLNWEYIQFSQLSNTTHIDNIKDEDPI